MPAAVKSQRKIWGCLVTYGCVRIVDHPQTEIHAYNKPVAKSCVAAPIYTIAANSEPAAHQSTRASLHIRLRPRRRGSAQRSRLRRCRTRRTRHPRREWCCASRSSCVCTKFGSVSRLRCRATRKEGLQLCFNMLRWASRPLYRTSRVSRRTFQTSTATQSASAGGNH